MNKTRNRTATRQHDGFTLIELLTVIAIIAILAGLTFGALPRVLEKAREKALTNNLNQIRTALVTYMADHGSYPPGYGFRSWATRGQTWQQVQQDPRFREDNDLSKRLMQEVVYYLIPLSGFLRLNEDKDIVDEFSEGYDTDRDNQLGMMEYSPIPQEDVVTGVKSYPLELYLGNNLSGQVQQQMSLQQRPFIYVPVNLRQFKTVRKYWLERAAEIGTDANGTNAALEARIWEPNDPRLRNVTFPPATYDAFVLISVGPGTNTHGILANTPITGTGINQLDWYHISALRTYFLATRDLNTNGELDFDFTARTKRGEGSVGPYEVRTKRGTFTTDNDLPDPKMPGGQGPWIYKYE